MTEASKVGPEEAYFRDIERAFVERRGDPLFISNADWVFLARLWRKQVPKRVVLRGLTDAFDAHAHSFSRKQKIKSLKYCEAQITAAVDRYRRSLQSEGPTGRQLGAAILRLEARIAADAVPPGLAAAVTAARQRLLQISESAEDASFDTERALTVVEDSLIEAASQCLGVQELSGIDQATREATSAYKARMPPTVYETLIEESVRRKILQRFGLPRLLLAEIE